VTLSVLTHKETENKCPIASPERVAHRHPQILSQPKQSLKRNFNPDVRG
jgi:hypothetical protein